MDQRLKYKTSYQLHEFTGQSIQNAFAADGDLVDVRLYIDDPFLWLACAVYDVSAFRVKYRFLHDGPSNRTAVRENVTFLQSLRLFSQVLSQQQAPVERTPVGNWNGRTSIAQTGLHIPGHSVINMRIRDAFIGTGVSFSANAALDAPFPLYVGPHSPHISPVGFNALLRSFWKDSTVVSYTAYHAGYQRRMTLTLDSLSLMHCVYKVEERSEVYSTIGTGVIIRYDCLISYNEESLFVAIYNDHIFAMAGDTQGEFLGSGFLKRSVSSKMELLGDRVVTKDRPHFLDVANRLTIRHFIGGLYHTQMAAITKLLGEASRNFESFVESPQFLAMVADVVITDFHSVPVLRALYNASPLKKVGAVLKALSGLYLAAVFAVKPSLEFFAESMDGVKKKVRESQESAMVFDSEDLLFEELPESLRNLLNHMAFGGVVAFKVTVRSQVWLSLSDEELIDFIMEVKKVADAGVRPSANYIWQGYPLTFVVDMFLPISALIADAEAYFGAFTYNAITSGHSVNISVDDEVGNTHQLYLRSDMTTHYFDPPAESWRISSGASHVLIPLVIQRLL